MAQLITVATPISDTSLELLSLTGHEELSRPFEYTVVLRSTVMSQDFSAVLGQPITVTLTDAAGTAQYIRGVVTEFSHNADYGTRDTIYTATLRPTFWLLSLRSDYKIFQKKSVTDIIKAVFSDAGFTDFKDSTTGTYTAQDFIVQYGETAMDFVSRLMEQAGIFYFFEHTSSAVTLVMADDASAYADIPGTTTIPFAARVVSSEDEAVLLGTVEQRIVPTSYKLNDYNFTTPAAALTSNSSGATTYQLYEYPGKYLVKGDGDSLASVRIAEQDAMTKTFRGRSIVTSFHSGHKFTMSGHPRADANAAWMIQAMDIHIADGNYSNQFTAIPATVVYRPPRLTPRPTIKGTQTATVTGKSGEEIWTDQYGRVTVHFHWDTAGQSDETSSCFIRVAQLWAGKSWGALFTPRVGDEVVVAFVDGDPDQPIVIGSVYNATQTMPYTLPADQTKSTIKTNSSKGGTTFNELRFEDKKDSEEVFLQAQKDLNISVLTGNSSFTVAKGNETHSTKGTRTYTVEGDETRSNKAKLDATITGAETHTNSADFTQKITGKTTITATGDEAHTNSANFKHDVTGNYTLNVTGNLTIKATGSVTIESGTGFTAKGGTTMTVQGGTGTTVKAGTQLALEGGATAELKGAAQTAIKGGLVQIN